MASFTSKGDTATLNVSDKGEKVSIALSGTYDMTIVFQREAGSPGSGAWITLKEWSTADATVAYTYYTLSYDERLRLIVTVDTSGTCTATITNAASEGFDYVTIRDRLGNPLLSFDQGGATFHSGDITIAGSINIPDAVTDPNFTEDLVFGQANPEILGSDTDGAMYVSPETTNALGGNVVLYGSTHASKAGDIELRNTETAVLSYDHSGTVIIPAQDVQFSQADPEIRGGDTNGALYVSPETTNALGGNVVLYGSTHATKAGDIELRNTATAVLSYDHSGTVLIPAQDVQFSNANPEVRGGDTDGALYVSPETTNALGGNVVLYGSTHASKAGDIELRNTETAVLSYDHSGTVLIPAQDVQFSQANPEVRGGDTDGAMYVSPSTTKDLGGNIVLYGDTHASKAKDIELRATTGVEAHYDDSASKWDFAANVIATTGEVQAGNVRSSEKFVLFEDFYGTWAIGDAGPADKWSTTAGNGTNNAAATTVANSLNGEVTIKSASDDGNNAANNSALTGVNLGWKANQGGLAIEARLKIDDIVEAYVFVGFTDVISTTVESPISFTDGSDTLIADANDACGIVFTGDSTTQEFAHGGVKATAATAGAFAGVAPVNTTYVTLRVEVSAAGAVQGYVDGVAIPGGAIANAVTVTTALTPAVIVGNTAAAQTVMTVDYVKVEQDR